MGSQKKIGDTPWGRDFGVDLKNKLMQYEKEQKKKSFVRRHKNIF